MKTASSRQCEGESVVVQTWLTDSILYLPAGTHSLGIMVLRSEVSVAEIRVTETGRDGCGGERSNIPGPAVV